MVIDILILFLSAFLSGLILVLIPKQKRPDLKYLLIFAGSYLFSITIIHLLPEIFSHHENTLKVGYFVLLGFFMQLTLEHFTSGVEHGHLHYHINKESQFFSRPAFLVLGLSIHSFLEGSLLAHPTALLDHHSSKALLIGIVLHKIPAAIALISILLFEINNKGIMIIYLFLFAIASPAGYILSDYFIATDILSDDVFLMLFAIVSGNFLHISTTIFFENNPEHQMKFKKLIFSVMGAFSAILAEFFL